MKKIILLFMAAACGFLLASAQNCPGVVIPEAGSDTIINISNCNPFLTAKAGPAYTQGTSWIDPSGTYGNGLIYPAAFSLQGKVYITLGTDDTNHLVTPLFEYDPAAGGGAGAWQQVADLGADADYPAGAFTINDTGYVIMVNTGNMFGYDNASNSWQSKQVFGGGPAYNRQTLQAFTIGSIAYVLGGGNAGSPNDVWAYDATTDSWAFKNPYPGTGFDKGAAFRIGSLGYAGVSTFSSDFYEYNPTFDTWQRRADFPGAERSGPISFAIGSAGYIGMGQQFGPVSFPDNRDMWKYDPLTDAWEFLGNFPGTMRLYAAAVSTGTQAYITMGVDPTSGNNLNDIWQFNAPDAGFYTNFQWAVDGNPVGTGTPFSASIPGTYVVTATDAGGTCTSKDSVIIAPLPSVDYYDTASNALSTVIITGHNFYNVGNIIFGGTVITPAEYYLYDSTSIGVFPTGGSYANDSIGLVSRGCDTTWLTGLTYACVPGIWQGTVSSDWRDPANWCNSTVPDSTINVYIPYPVPNYPTISDSAIVDSLFVPLGSSLTVSAGGTLEIKGDLANDNYANVMPINAIEGAMVFDGQVQQNIYGDVDVKDLTINNENQVWLYGNNYSGSSYGTSVWVYNTYNPKAGLMWPDDYALVFSSDSISTATVMANNNNEEYMRGVVEVQRYIPARRAWRMLTSPLSNSGTIYDNWQNGGNVCSCGASGVELWSPYGGNGFDANPVAGTGATSIRYYDEIADTWVDVDNTQTTDIGSIDATAANKAFAVFVTGPYGDLSTIRSTSAKPTTLHAAGDLQINAQEFDFAAPAGNYILIGNPYASPINFGTIGKTGVDNNMWVWDPHQQTIGGYVAFTSDGAGGYMQDVDPAYTAQRQYIQNGQAFFVQANDATQQIVINESDKADTSLITSRVFFAPIPGGTSLQQMRISLFKSVNNNMSMADGMLLRFSDGYKKDSTDDVAKLYGYAENLSLAINAGRYGISRLPMPVIGDTLQLSTHALNANTSYSFEVKPQNIAVQGLGAWLVDTYLNTKTPLSLTANTNVVFTTTSNKASQADGRFIVVFAKEGALATVVTSVKAWQVDNGIQVAWSTATEQGIKQYAVEKSTDGQQFAPVSSALPKNNGSTVTYNWVDEQAAAGNNYYRIKLLTADAQPQYSNVALVTLQKGGLVVNAYPNPVPHKQQLQVQLGNLGTGIYTLQLYDMQGKILLQKTVRPNGNANQTVTLNPAGLAAANYRLVLMNKDGVVWKQQVVVQ